MDNFNYQNTTKVIFGKDSEFQLPNEIKKYGSKILLHYGGKSIFKTGLYEKITKILKENKIEFIELGGVTPNPKLTLVRKGIKICKENKIEFILAIGGGSVIDSSKAIGVGSLEETDIWKFYCGEAEVTKTLPVGVVLTIPAAGSETSLASVITNENGQYKRDIGNNLIRPVFAIMNPETTFTLPAYQTAAGSVDIISHVMERYFTNTKNVELTDTLCEGVIRTIINNSKKALENPFDYDARAEIMWGSTIAHNDLLGTGRVGDWASHMIEHELSGIYDIAHGAGLAIVTPAWMKYVYKSNINKFAQFANRVFHVEINLEDLEETALAGITLLEEFFKELKMPTRLSQVDIDNSRFIEMSEKAVENGNVGNLKSLNKEDVLNIYNLCL